MSLSIPTIPTLHFQAQTEARQQLAAEGDLSAGIEAYTNLILRLIGIRGADGLGLARKADLIFAGSYRHLTGDPAADDQKAAALLDKPQLLHRLAQQQGVRLKLIDVGLSGPELKSVPQIEYQPLRIGNTQDMAQGAALSLPEVQDGIWVGMNVVSQAIATGLDLLTIGTIGQGGPLAATAIAAVLLETPLSDLVAPLPGKSPQLTPAGQVELIQRAIDLNQPEKVDPLDILRCVGGTDIAAATGAMLAAAAGGIPIVLNNSVTAAAALIATYLDPAIRAYFIAGQLTDQPTHRAILRHLGLDPLLITNIKSGLGEGGILAFNSIETLVNAYRANRSR